MAGSEPMEGNVSPPPGENEEKMQRLLIRAVKDEAWRQELLTNPKALIERELGITIPQDMTVVVHEDTGTTVHLVLPPRVLPEVPVSDVDRELLRREPLMLCNRTCLPGVSVRCSDTTYRGTGF